VTEAIYPPGTTTPVVKTSTFEWQRDGVIKKHSLDGQASTFQHRLDRLETEFTPFDGGSFPATWFDNASLATLQMPNGARVTNGYDGVSRLEQRQVKVGSTTLSAWTGIEYDDNGNRLRIGHK
jgi:hypothetical protein